MTHVLGLDLSKVGLGQALEAMAEAWLDAQGVDNTSGALPHAPDTGCAKDDEWEARLTAWICNSSSGSFTTQEALAGAGLETGRAAEMRAARILREKGFVKSQQTRTYGKHGCRLRVWIGPS